MLAWTDDGGGGPPDEQTERFDVVEQLEFRIGMG